MLFSLQQWVVAWYVPDPKLQAQKIDWLAAFTSLCELCHECSAL